MSETERSGKSRYAQRWTAAQASEFVERWRASGQSAATFAAQHAVSASRLTYWSKQLETQGDETPQFVAVTMPAATRSVHVVDVEVNGLTVRVREGADAAFVVQLICALQRGSTQPC